MRVDVKPVTRWIFARGYTVRFRERTPERVSGLLNTPAGEVAFVYDPIRRTIDLPGEQVRIDEYGWPINQDE
jgi:hypothetical protein